jgi:hypothetical protein
MSSTAERNLDGFLNQYRIVTIATESADLITANTIKKIRITVEQKEVTPEIFFSRSILPYFAPTEDKNSFTDTLTGTGDGITNEHARFFAGLTYLQRLGHEVLYDADQLRQAEFCTIGYSRNGTNMYGAFKPLYDNTNILLEYPQFYSITGANQPIGITAFTGVTFKGSSAGTYTIINFGGVLAPFQLLVHPSILGLTHSNGLPTATADSPLYFGLSANTGLTASIKSIYFTPDIHFSTRRNFAILSDRGMTFSGLVSSFEPYYSFIKTSDNDFMDGLTGMINEYVGNSANPAWSVELVRSSGKTANYLNIDGFNLSKSFNERFFNEFKTYPRRYRAIPSVGANLGQYSYPYTTSVFGWVSSIPTPGTARDGTGPYASIGASYFLNRIAGITFYPPPSTYNYLGPTGATSFGGSGGSSGWNTYHKSLTGESSFYNEYFMLGGATTAASNTYQASSLVPANILKLFVDNAGPRGPLGSTMNFLDSYYYDIYQEQLEYGGYKDMNFFAMEFVPRFNPFIPMQLKGSYQGSSTMNYTSRRDCTIHQDMGGNSAERLFNLKESMKATIHSSLKMWKLLLDARGKFNYRIIPVVSGRNEDYDLTRGGSVPYRSEDFVEYLVKPMFNGDVPANGFVLKNDVDQLLLNGFYLGNIGRGAAEYTKVVTNGGISGADPTTAFIRGLETYFFNLEQLQLMFTFPEILSEEYGLTAAGSEHTNYLNTFRSGRFSDYRVYETNTGLTGGNTKIPYGFNGTFRWYLVPLKEESIMYKNASLRDRWVSSINNNITTAYKIIRDAYFELSKEQLAAAIQYFEDNNITTLVEYRSTDQFVGR